MHLQNWHKADGWCTGFSVHWFVSICKLKEIHYWFISFAIFMFFTPRCPCCNKTLQCSHLGFSQHITHLMLITRCKLNCPSDIMPEDWYIDRVRLIRVGMMQQHQMIYSDPNILRQDCSEGIGCQDCVLSSPVQVSLLLQTAASNRSKKWWQFLLLQ